MATQKIAHFKILIIVFYKRYFYLRKPTKIFKSEARPLLQLSIHGRNCAKGILIEQNLVERLCY